MQTLQQLRAKHALGKIQGLKDYPGKEKLLTRASELPFMIHANGLGQAAAFFKSKGVDQDKDGYGQIFKIFESWLCVERNLFSTTQYPHDLIKAITECDLQTYRLAQAEAMQYMDWVKKFAKAYFSKESS